MSDDSLKFSRYLSHRNYPQDAKEMIDGWLKYEDKTKDHMDNIRIAECGNIEETKDYDIRRARGCCGYTDKLLIWTHMDYEVTMYFMVGFNYGH